MSTKEPNSFWHGVVVNNNDPNSLNKIQVRIISIDWKIEDNNDLEWCVAMQPAGFFMVPLVGEHVIVFLRNPWTRQPGRFYVGPIHSTRNAEFEPFKTTIEKLEIENNGL